MVRYVSLLTDLLKYVATKYDSHIIQHLHIVIAVRYVR